MFYITVKTKYVKTRYLDLAMGRDEGMWLKFCLLSMERILHCYRYVIKYLEDIKCPVLGKILFIKDLMQVRAPD